MQLKKQMDKKTWKEKLEGLKKLLTVAKFNEEKAKDDQEELSLIISVLEDKIAELPKEKKKKS